MHRPKLQLRASGPHVSYRDGPHRKLIKFKDIHAAIIFAQALKEADRSAASHSLSLKIGVL